MFRNLTRNRCSVILFVIYIIETEIEVAFFISTMPDVQGQGKTSEREECRKDMIPEVILLGRDIKSVTTVIAGWSAI